MTKATHSPFKTVFENNCKGAFRPAAYAHSKATRHTAPSIGRQPSTKSCRYYRGRSKLLREYGRIMASLDNWELRAGCSHGTVTLKAQTSAPAAGGLVKRSPTDSSLFWGTTNQRDTTQEQGEASSKMGQFYVCSGPCPLRGLFSLRSNDATP